MIISPAFEYMAYENRSLLKKINPLIKTALLLVYLFLNLWVEGYYYLTIFSLSLLLFIIARIPFSYVKRAVLLSVFIAAALFSVKFFLWKEKYLLNMAISSLRVIAGALLILGYVATTTLNDIISSLKKMKVPDICLETFIVIYRYIFIINDDGLRLKNAQMMRMGYRDFKTSIRSMGDLWGVLFLRAVGRAEKVVDALHVRGYRGTIYYPSEFREISSKDIIIFIFGLIPIVFGILCKL